MLTKRIIPCLDVRAGRVVKGVNFEGVRDVSSPVALAKYYSDAGADELLFVSLESHAAKTATLISAAKITAMILFILISSE